VDMQKGRYFTLYNAEQTTLYTVISIYTNAQKNEGQQHSNI
jgi:hypothetical protein